VGLIGIGRRNNFFLINANPFVVGRGVADSNAGMIEFLSSFFSTWPIGARPIGAGALA